MAAFAHGDTKSEKDRELTAIAAEDLLRLATRALHGQGFPSDLASEVAEEFVVAEIAGVKTHGMGKLVSLNLGNLTATPDVKVHGALLAIDGKGGNGFMVLRHVTDLVADMCPASGIAAAFTNNFSRYSSLYPYTESLAKRGLVTILANTAGPAAVAPFGSADAITGTNPICFSFPTPSGVPQTFDFATSEFVWGEIRQAALEGRGLPAGPFLDGAGEVTTTPADVNAVHAFGGAKGWALNLAIEILAGLLTGGRAGLDVESEFDCGAILIAIDPAATGKPNPAFAESVAQLLDSVRASRPERADVPVRSPGDRGRSRLRVADHPSEQVDVPETTLEMMRRMGDGEKITELSSNPLFN